MFIGSGSAWRHAAVCGDSDRLRFVERDDDLRDVVASSYKNESSTVDSVRTRPSSSVEDVDGRDTGGRQPGPLVCSVLTSAELNPAAMFARMLRSISSKNLRRSFFSSSRRRRSASPWSSRGFVQRVSLVNTS